MRLVQFQTDSVYLSELNFVTKISFVSEELAIWNQEIYYKLFKLMESDGDLADKDRNEQAIECTNVVFRFLHGEVVFKKLRANYAIE